MFDQNILGGAAQENEILRIETDFTLKNIGLVVGSDGTVRGYGFDFDGVTKDEFDKSFDSAVEITRNTKPSEGVLLSSFSRAAQDLILSRQTEPVKSKITGRAVAPIVDTDLEEEPPVSGLPPVEPTPSITPTPEAVVAPVEPVVPVVGAVEPTVTEVAPEVKSVRQFKLADVEPPTNLEGWRALRNERIAAERQLLQEEIGLTPEQAEGLHEIYIVRNSDNTERWVKRNLSPEQVSKFEAFDEGQFNERGGPVEFLEYDSDFNPEFLDVENDAPSLANAIVQAFTKGKPEQGLNDKWIYAVGAIQKLEAVGGSRQDISDALTQQAQRVAGSEGMRNFGIANVEKRSTKPSKLSPRTYQPSVARHQQQSPRHQN